MPFGFGSGPTKPIGKRRRDMRARVEDLEAALRAMVEHDEYLIRSGVLRPFVELERAQALLARK